jgi:putative ABC transport system permease protein
VIRSLVRQKLDTGIIIVSLTIGIACINMIMMFIIRELGTDGFHKNVERIYALKCDDPFAKGARIFQVRSGAAEYMKLNFSQVEDFCRTRNAISQKIIANNESWTEKPGIIAASPNFFDFFSYQLLSNNPKKVLEAPNSLVISEEIAMKYFGTVAAEGQVIRLIYRDREEQYVVSKEVTFWLRWLTGK